MEKYSNKNPQLSEYDVGSLIMKNDMMLKDVWIL